MRFGAAICGFYQHPESLDNNLALGYMEGMTNTSDAARTLAHRSIEARRRKWGQEGFRERMRAWGKLGGRPHAKKGKPDGH